MLQAVSNSHDRHHEHAERNSAATVDAARHDGKVHLLLAASGSVATIKLPNIILALGRRHPRLSIRVVLTSSAAAFLAGQAAEQPTVSALSHLPCVEAVYLDRDEWDPAWRRGQSILHIALRKWADLLVVAPLSANTLAKVVNGMCDNLLTSIIRAWDTTGLVDDAERGGRQARRKILVAVAMNTAMWRHPVTARQIKVLEEEWGGDQGWFEVLRPMEKELACGDVGEGAMKAWEEIVEVIEQRLELKAPGEASDDE